MKNFVFSDIAFLMESFHVYLSLHSMQIHTYSQIGTFHTNHNEDCLVTAEIAENQLLIAVMDGCSMGTESHFASTLIGKILRKIAKEMYYLSFRNNEFKSLKVMLKHVIKSLFQQLIQFKNDLALERYELLSTLILGIIDTKSKSAELITIGDGIVIHNGQITEYEQDNQPDYLGYHLDKPFEEWFSIQNQFLSLKNLYDLSISTDGIFTFRKFDNQLYPLILEADIIHQLCIQQENINRPFLLKNRVIDIEKIFGLKPTDDLTIVRLVWK